MMELKVEEKKKKKKEEIVNVSGFGKVFVEYYDIEDSKKAQRALSGRRYDGRMVITSFHPEEKWKIRNLEPDPLKIEDVYLKQEELKEEVLLMQQELKKWKENSWN